MCENVFGGVGVGGYEGGQSIEGSQGQLPSSVYACLFYVLHQLWDDEVDYNSLSPTQILQNLLRNLINSPLPHIHQIHQPSHPLITQHIESLLKFHPTPQHPLRHPSTQLLRFTLTFPHQLPITYQFLPPYPPPSLCLPQLIQSLMRDFIQQIWMQGLLEIVEHLE